MKTIPFAGLPLSHLLLLRAVWARGADFPPAWAAWREAADFAALDPQAYGLLPALCHNLERHNSDDGLRPLLAGIYRKSWAANQLLGNRIAEVAAALAGLGIPLMLLPATALALVRQTDVGLYALATGDVLVRPENAARAAEVLSQLGWHSREAERRRRPFSPLYRALTFTRAEGLRLALYWHPGLCGADDALWDKALTVKLGGVRLGILAPARALAEVCTEAGAGLRVGWMGIALALLHTQEIDWPEFLANPHASAGLSLLASQVTLPVTPEVLSQLPAAQKGSGWLTRASSLWRRCCCQPRKPGDSCEDAIHPLDLLRRLGQI